MSHPWEGKPWAPWFACYREDTGAVDPPPFDTAAFFPHPTQNEWGAIVAINPRGHGILAGSCWASRACADQVALVLGGTVEPIWYLLAQQPQFNVRITQEGVGYLDVNPGEIADRFISQAGPFGRSAEYIDWWLTRMTAFTPGNFVPTNL